MAIWFTSDHHFEHKNIIQYCNRPFDTVAEMNKTMIDKWNEVVNEDDVVYHLGDFTLGGTEMAQHYFKQLKGYIRVIPGGHDYRWVDNISGWSDYLSLAILPPLYTLELDKQIIVLCHYAMRVWDRSHYGSIHLYGHSHGMLSDSGNRSMDIGVDTNNFYPYSLNDILKLNSNPYINTKGNK